jgi:hypothetical protein
MGEFSEAGSILRGADANKAHRCRTAFSIRVFEMKHSRALLVALMAAGIALSFGCKKEPRGVAPGSSCLNLDRETCQATPACEAIPYWGESLVACNVDARGFADNCPFEGCRGAHANCPTLADLGKRCPTPCSYNDYAIDAATGCRSCDCRAASPVPGVVKDTE